MLGRIGVSFALAIPLLAHGAAGQCTFRVGVSSEGQYPFGLTFSGKLTPDGRCVSFVSNASNLVPGDNGDFRDVFVHDRLLGVTTRVSVKSNGLQANGDSYSSSISADG